MDFGNVPGVGTQLRAPARASLRREGRTSPARPHPWFTNRRERYRSGLCFGGFD